ncbi:MAG: tetratricopeptide repeat protein [Chloroflexi bacterium]|nr:tetratricopeptide repeat protein [Chloroflexota bacterium]
MGAIEKGDNARARDLLMRLIKLSPTKPDYWLWMSAMVETPKERIYCLKEVLKLDPQSADAQRGLAMFGAMPVNPDLVVPLHLQRRRWDVERLDKELKDAHQAKKFTWKTAVLYLSTFIFIVALLSLVIWGASSVFGKKRAVAYLGPTLTYAPTLTKAVNVTAVSGSATPMWMQLQATYTPTPLYVSTPHNIEAYSIALRAYGRGEYEKAITNIYQAITLEPNSVDLYYHLGESYRLQGSYNEAIRTFNQVIKLQSDFAPGYLGLGRTLIDSDPAKWQDAQSDLEKAIILDPNIKEAYLELARLSLSLEDAQTALTQLAGAPQSVLESPLFYLYRSQAELLLEQFDKAIADARQAIQMDVTLLPAYRLLGETLVKAGLPGDAMTPLKIVTTYQAGDVQAWVWLGAAYGAQQDTDNALKAFSQALSLNKNFLDVYLQRGLVYIQMKDGARAKADLTVAVRIKPDSFAAKMALGEANMLLQDYGGAWKQFAESESLAKTDAAQAEMLYWRGQSLEALNLPNTIDSAIRDYQALLELPVENVPIAWRDFATRRLAILTATNTPISKTTVTGTLTPTPTRISGVISSPAGTQTATRTLTPTPTPTPR